MSVDMPLPADFTAFFSFVSRKRMNAASRMAVDVRSSVPAVPVDRAAAAVAACTVAPDEVVGEDVVVTNVHQYPVA